MLCVERMEELVCWERYGGDLVLNARSWFVTQGELCGSVPMIYSAEIRAAVTVAICLRPPESADSGGF